MSDADALDEYREQFLAVQRYQQGDPEAALLLLEAFSDFLDGFVILLRGGQVKRLTYSHRLFISNFIKNGRVARALKTRTPFSGAFLAAESAMVSVATQLKPIDEEDLRQEINEVFLATLKRYRSRNDQNYLIPYILKSFPYALTRRVQQLVKDPLVNLASDKIESLDDLGTKIGEWSLGEAYGRVDRMLNKSPHLIQEISLTIEESQALLSDDELNAAWLRGDTCDESLDVLSYAERRILKQFYFLDMTDAEIALELGVSYNTAIRRRHHILTKLRGGYAIPHCRWCDEEIPKAPLGRQPRQCKACRRTRKTQSQRERRAA